MILGYATWISISLLCVGKYNENREEEDEKKNAFKGKYSSHFHMYENIRVFVCVRCVTATSTDDKSLTRFMRCLSYTFGKVAIYTNGALTSNRNKLFYYHLQFHLTCSIFWANTSHNCIADLCKFCFHRCTLNGCAFAIALAAKHQTNLK